MKTVFLAGATGSIGLNTLNCIEYLNASKHLDVSNQQELKYELKGFSARTNLEEARNILKKYPIKVAAIDSKENLAILKSEFPQVNFFQKSEDAVIEADFDIVVNALTGSSGLLTTLRSIPRKSTIMLANKESLVMAGHLINQELKGHQTTLIPVDSEHSAIFLLLKNYRKEEISRIILTASGGPFFRNPNANPSIEEALNHPNWKMGKKISIDSATMMNKGLEVIEAHHLFDTPYEQIDTIIHPQSIVHSIIETIDGEQYAQLGSADMRHPIQNALTHPHTVSNPLKKFNLFDHKTLEFYPPDLKRFPMLRIAYECGKKGGSHPIVMNAANEEAVYCFLEGKIEFKEIEEKVEEALIKQPFSQHPELEEILIIDREVKEQVRKKI